MSRGQGYILHKKDGVKMTYFTKLIVICFTVMFYLMFGLQGCTNMNHENSSNIEESIDYEITYVNQTHLKICLQSWRQEIIDLQDAVNCIDAYVKANNTPSNTR